MLDRRKTFSKYLTGCSTATAQFPAWAVLDTKENPEGSRVVIGHHSRVYHEHVPTSQGYTNTVISSKGHNFCGDPADSSALAGMKDWAVDKRLEETYWIIQMISIETKRLHTYCIDSVSNNLKKTC